MAGKYVLFGTLNGRKVYFIENANGIHKFTKDPRDADTWTKKCGKKKLHEVLDWELVANYNIIEPFGQETLETAIRSYDSGIHLEEQKMRYVVSGYLKGKKVFLDQNSGSAPRFIKDPEKAQNWPLQQADNVLSMIGAMKATKNQGVVGPFQKMDLSIAIAEYKASLHDEQNPFDDPLLDICDDSGAGDSPIEGPSQDVAQDAVSDTDAKEDCGAGTGQGDAGTDAPDAEAPAPEAADPAAEPDPYEETRHLLIDADRKFHELVRGIQAAQWFLDKRAVMYGIVGICDKLEVDLLHDIENWEGKEEDIDVSISDIRSLRRKRRIAKNSYRAVEVCSEIADWLRNYGEQLAKMTEGVYLYRCSVANRDYLENMDLVEELGFKDMGLDVPVQPDTGTEDKNGAEDQAGKTSRPGQPGQPSQLEETDKSDRPDQDVYIPSSHGPRWRQEACTCPVASDADRARDDGIDKDPVNDPDDDKIEKPDQGTTKDADQDLSLDMDGKADKDEGTGEMEKAEGAVGADVESTTEDTDGTEAPDDTNEDPSVNEDPGMPENDTTEDDIATENDDIDTKVNDTTNDDTIVVNEDPDPAMKAVPDKENKESKTDGEGKDDSTRTDDKPEGTGRGMDPTDHQADTDQKKDRVSRLAGRKLWNVFFKDSDDPMIA